MDIKLELHKIFPHNNAGLILSGIPSFLGHATKYIQKLKMDLLQCSRDTF